MEKQLRQGYTTGSCATAATGGALTFLLTGEKREAWVLKIPKGKVVQIPLQDYDKGDGWASCGAKKDSGDDPDVTDGALIYSKVRLEAGPAGKITIDGGPGVGRVTKPGLAREVGEAAINPIPMEMIRQEAHGIMESLDYEGAVHIEISVPKGEVLAKKTFNSKLGIIGGISILGTTGIVEPMSEKALVDTIKMELDVLFAAGEENLVMTPGNYGEKFLKSNTKISPEKIIKCSNFIGDTLEHAAAKGFQSILLVGHVGKLVKVAGGVRNTHSKYGDRRMEILEDYARRSGGSPEFCGKLSHCVTTEDAVNLLQEEDLWKAVLEKMLADIEKHMGLQTGEIIKVGAIVYSNVHGYLGETPLAGEIRKRIEECVKKEG